MVFRDQLDGWFATANEGLQLTSSLLPLYLLQILYFIIVMLRHMSDQTVRKIYLNIFVDDGPWNLIKSAIPIWVWHRYFQVFLNVDQIKKKYTSFFKYNFPRVCEWQSDTIGIFLVPPGGQ